MKSIAFRHIYRVDCDVRSTHAWQVHLNRNNQRSSKVFSDGVWGGKRKALAAARAWRDARLQPLAEYGHELWRRNVLRRNNRSGIVGVARYERRPTESRKAGKGAYWLAFWTDEHGLSRKRKFAVGAWGERNAKQMAIQEREQQVRRAVAARTLVGEVHV
jgi:hypothetical protein